MFRSFSIVLDLLSAGERYAGLCTCTHDHQRGSSDAPAAERESDSGWTERVGGPRVPGRAVES